jgi:maltose alpha-D-glucosyltransferase/alpha-amylase
MGRQAIVRIVPQPPPPARQPPLSISFAQASLMAHDTALSPDPLWYKDAVIYEVPVRAFADSSGDGIGDFAGLTGKLSYIESLGVTAIWLLPFCASPWKDDGYDTSNYTEVHPAYGTLRDFQVFLREAHRRGLRVITELVLNHTSDQHAWFQRSRRAAAGSRWRNFYVWSDTPDRYRDARIIFKDFETSNWTWDPVGKAYYWHRFYSHQPDLNYDNPEVKAAVLEAVDIWLELGVDGLRLDAVPYLFEREGTNCENLPETHDFLKELRAHIDSKFKDRLLLAEANQWPEDAIAYFGKEDECHMAFHFPLMPRMFMSIRMEDRYPIADILRLTPAIPPSCQWALFLRNHDELTLEMVTDEERDYMYRVYAHDQTARINLGIRRRLAPLLENDRRRIELMHALILSLPGTPVLYYGDEIGMGDNFYLGDRNGVRTPMQWNGDRNAGFSAANPQKLYLPVVIDPEYHYGAINVETQHNSPHSLLWWTRRLIGLRRQYHAFGRGSIEFFPPENRKVLSFVRAYGAERILVVANLSRFGQCAELPLAPFKGMVPRELFGQTAFPPITDAPYILTIGPHSFFWFSLEPPASQEVDTPVSASRGQTTVSLTVSSWDAVFDYMSRAAIERELPRFLSARRWFFGGGRSIARVRIHDVIRFPHCASFLVIIGVVYTEGDPESYLLPLSLAVGQQAGEMASQFPERLFAALKTREGEQGLLYSGFRNVAFQEELLGLMSRRRRVAGEQGEILGSHTKQFRRIWGSDRPALDPSVSKVDQHNTSVLFGDRFVFKMFRRIEHGIHPELENGLALAAAKEKLPIAPVAGWIEYRSPRGESAIAGILHGFVEHETDGWQFTLENLSLFFERALSLEGDHAKPPQALRSLTSLVGNVLPETAEILAGSYWHMARLLGARVAEFHLAMASAAGAAFEPEPFTDLYCHSLYHGLLAGISRGFEALRARGANVPADAAADCELLLARQPEAEAWLQQLRNRRFSAKRIRIHGSLELGQALYTGKDFVLIDLEGEPDRPIGERRIKRSPLRDVAGMIESFYYASQSVWFGKIPGIIPVEGNTPALRQWAEVWFSWAAGEFLNGYLETPGIGDLVPVDPEELSILLNAYLLERAMREITSELVDRPEWIRVPVRAALGLLPA